MRQLGRPRPPAIGHRAVRAAFLGGVAAGALAVGAIAIGALAIGRMAVGRLAVGRLAVGRFAAGRARIEHLSIGTLVVEHAELPNDGQASR